MMEDFGKTASFYSIIFLDPFSIKAGSSASFGHMLSLESLFLLN